MASPNIPASEDSDSSSYPGPIFLNRQRAADADWRDVQRFLRVLCSRASKAPFNVCMFSDRSIGQYNKRFRRQDKATDVLSFPAAKDRAEEEDYLGDILISVETARDNAERYGLTLEDEIK